MTLHLTGFTARPAGVYDTRRLMQFAGFMNEGFESEPADINFNTSETTTYWRSTICNMRLMVFLLLLNEVSGLFFDNRMLESYS